LLATCCGSIASGYLLDDWSVIMDWYDYEQQKAIVPPPVGSIVEYKINERSISNVEITGHGKYGLLTREMPESRDEK